VKRDSEDVEPDAEDFFEHEDSNEEPDEKLESEEDCTSSEESAMRAEEPTPKSSGRSVEPNRIRNSENKAAAKHPSLPKSGSPNTGLKHVVKKRRRNAFGSGAPKKTKRRYAAG
jgi:hypothetical protein